MSEDTIAEGVVSPFPISHIDDESSDSVRNILQMNYHML